MNCFFLASFLMLLALAASRPAPSSDHNHRNSSATPTTFSTTIQTTTSSSPTTSLSSLLLPETRKRDDDRVKTSNCTCEFAGDNDTFTICHFPSNSTEIACLGCDENLCRKGCFLISFLVCCCVIVIFLICGWIWKKCNCQEKIDRRIDCSRWFGVNSYETSSLATQRVTETPSRPAISTISNSLDNKAKHEVYVL